MRYKAETIGSVLDDRQGFGPGFDILRIVLALLSMSFHAAATIRDATLWDSSPLWFLKYSLVPLFFALSGFLITASALRLSLWQFLINRSLRIVPALAVEIILSALIIGPLFTTLPLKVYFTNPQFYHYFTNIVGLINFNLPGVFYEHHEVGTVNGALWTIPYEIACYIIITGLILLALIKRPLAMCVILVAWGMFPAVLEAFGIEGGLMHIPRATWLLTGRGVPLFLSFISGCILYAAKDYIPLNKWIAFAMVGAIVILAIFGSLSCVLHYHLALPLCIILAYLTVAIGLANVPQLPIISKGDYSYGIYLYHCPLINSVYHFLPDDASFFVVFPISLFLVCLFAAFSWHVIERPILRARKKFHFVTSQHRS